jgi:hypothetical protein
MRHLIDYALLGAKVIIETAQMRDDEINVWVEGGQLLHDHGTADDIHHDRYTESSRNFAYFTRGRGVDAMDFDSSESMFSHGPIHHTEDVPGMSCCVDENEADQTFRESSHNPRHLFVAGTIIPAKLGKHYRLGDSGDSRPPQIGEQRGAVGP